VGDHVAAKGHSYNAVVTAPTCTEDGYTTYTCSVCGDHYVGNEVVAKGHTAAAPVKENFRTTQDGSYYDSVIYCEVCGEELSRTAVPCGTLTFDTVFAEHGDIVCMDVTVSAMEYAGYRLTVKYGEGLKLVEIAAGDAALDFFEGDPENGIVCDYAVQNALVEGVIFKLYFQVAEDAAVGEYQISCDIMGFYTENSEDVPVAVVEGAVSVHMPDYKVDVTKPTCVDEGYTTYTCTICGKSHVADRVPAKGHSYKAEVTAPTCTAEGYTTHTCTVCGDSYVTDKVSATGHSYGAGSVTTAPTCTDKGVMTYTCTICGKTKTDEIAPTGHSYKAEVTAPTCTDEGYTTHTCSGCGDSYVDSKVPAKGHTASGAVQENHRYIDGDYCCDEVVRCAVCGCELSRSEVHLYTVGNVNGDGEISVLDAMLVAQRIVGDITDADLNVAAADVNGDGEISVLDAMLIAQFIVGDIDEFPIEVNK
jgi:hypothetical protein